MSEDSPNGSSETKIPTPEIYKCCDNPQITYNAPVNINVEEHTIGSVDGPRDPQPWITKYIFLE